MRTPFLSALLFCGLVFTGALSGGEPSPAETQLAAARKLAQEKNWAEARTAFDRVRKAETDGQTPNVRAAVEGAVECALKLQQWDDATKRLEEFIGQTKGSLAEARGLRLLGGLYLTMPHQGLKQGGVFLRGQSGQGVYVYSMRKDQREAVARYERAREVVGWLREHFDEAGNRDTPERRQALEAELIGLDFDLAAALAVQNDSPYGGGYGICGWWWKGAFEPEEDSEAVEQADYDEPRYFRGWSGQNQEPPTGVPLGPDGQPQFLTTPESYSGQLGAGPKIRYLLAEIQRLDATEKKEDAAKALFRAAMIARSLYGPETALQLAQQQVRYSRFGRPLPTPPDPDAPKTKIWELSEEQALTIVGGRLQVVTLPRVENPFALLHELETRYPQSSLVPEALYARALLFQTRQQFPEALAAYDTLIQKFPKHARAEDARQQSGGIKQADIMLGNSTVYLPEQKPKLSLTYRNAERIEFKAVRFDLAKYVSDNFTARSDNQWEFRDAVNNPFRDEKWKKYLRATAAEWTENVPRPEGLRTAEGSTEAPCTATGAYIVEARVAGSEHVSRLLMLVTDLALVQKNAKDFGLIYLCHARTGQPLAEKAVRLYEHWNTYDQSAKKNQLHLEETTLVTDAEGVVKFKRSHSNQGSSVEAVVIGENERMAFSFFQNFNEAQYVQGEYLENGARNYVVTDRPVYRPGAVVQFRIWQRMLVDRTYQPAKAGSITVEIWDAKNNRVQSETLKLDEFGGASGEFKLGDEPPLGLYTIRLDGVMPDAHRQAGGIFRVEEYKKPEFEVRVKPATTQARLGEKFKARIEARYYFGAPVAQGTVNYKVFRENYEHLYFGPGDYDWLYGKGYGRARYAYPWFPWWGRWGCFICCEGPWPGGWWPGSFRMPWGSSYGDDNGSYSSGYGSGTRKALRELVAQGTAALKPDGTYEVEVDTATTKAAQGNRDHRFTVEAEVRDASRRTIVGQGSVIVTRQEFYAFVETDQGWYSQAGDVRAEVRTLTPDNVPVAVKGEVTVRRVRYGGPNHDEVQEEIVKQWPAETDAEGRLSFRWPIAGEGQWRVTFRAQDSWQEEVLGNAVFWARGPKFDGRVYRFNDLEIISDKRTYEIGETAHLLINVAENNSRILLSENVTRGALLSYRFLEIPQRSLVVDVPIEAKRVPNFFVEATLVRNGRVQTESREILVPPVRGLMNLTLKTDKPVYQPGETGTVELTATDATGQPLACEVALTAFDEAVTYIQDEFGPSPRVFFHGQKRYHQPEMSSSTEQLFQSAGRLRAPQNEVYVGAEPEGWRGTWNLDGRGFRLDLERNAGGRELSKFSASSSFTGGLAGAADLGFASAVSSDKVVITSVPMSTAAPAARQDGDAASTPGAPGPALVEPAIRTQFADTALWLPSMRLGANGRAETKITFPQSLTTWRLHGYAITKTTQTGDFTTKATTTKNLLVRLQSPRFFIERDEVVLSANVNNYLPTEQKVKAELILPAALFSDLCATAGELAQDAEGNYHLLAEANVPAKGEHRFDWPVKVLKAGMAKITVKALTAEESDGMRLAFPVLVHGISKTVAQSGSFRVSDEGERTLKLDLPAEIDPEQTRLEIQLSPSLAGVMVDALPYLVGYPYGCVEQTMSRFYPSVLVRETLKKMGLDLETIGKQRRQMNAADLRQRYDRSPVFDSDELDRMVKAGLHRIYGFQRNDGGWGWWKEDDSSIYQTAYVLQGLFAARKAGVNVDGGVYERGFSYLQNAINGELAKPKEKRSLSDFTTQAYLAYILSLEHRLQSGEQKKWLSALYEGREGLNNYGRSLLALAMHQEKRTEEAKTLLRNVLQFVERDDSNETAWVRTPQAGWWFWYNNDIETNAWALRALVTIDPKNDLAPRLVKWLLNNRHHGYYWHSTRDTAQVIAAMTDYLLASGEGAPDYTLTVSLDGEPEREVKVNQANLFTFDSRVLRQGLQVKPGPHQVTVTKKGSGALYYSSYLTYFTKEEDVKGAGNEILVERQYFKLVPKTETVRLPSEAAMGTHPGNQPVALEQTGRTEARAGFTRVPLKTGDEVVSGDQIEVVLNITAKNTYDFLAFEDMKPAGCEPVELRSGGRWAGGLCANLELRDEKVVFFIGLLEQGKHVLRYKLRAETPGHFHALPTSGSAMYAPEVRAISDEMRLRVRD